MSSETGEQTGLHWWYRAGAVCLVQYSFQWRVSRQPLHDDGINYDLLLCTHGHCDSAILQVSHSVYQHQHCIVMNHVRIGLTLYRNKMQRCAGSCGGEEGCEAERWEQWQEQLSINPGNTIEPGNWIADYPQKWQLTFSEKTKWEAIINCGGSKNS